MSEKRERVVENVTESEVRKEERWRKAGKGKGNRWLMLRDLLSILSLRPMSITLVQDTMFLHRGLKRATIREMLDQLDKTKSIEQVEDKTQILNQWVWVATPGGAAFWLPQGSRAAIPAFIVRVAYAMKSVPASGGIDK